MTYTIPHTTVEVHRVLPGVHASPDTAYTVPDYPYGFRLRCKMRYWLEYAPKKGFRLWSQTTNPKKVGEVWNKPKASAYSRFGGAMFLDQQGHVQWTGLSEYSTTEQCVEWREQFLAGVPVLGQKLTETWVAAKLAYDARTKKEAVS